MPVLILDKPFAVVSGNLERELFGGFFKRKEIFQLLVSQNVKNFILCVHFKCLLGHNSSMIMYDLKVVDQRLHKTTAEYMLSY